MIAGAYGTGRELVEFFLFLGPVAGLLGMFVTMIVLSAVLAATFEFARRFALYDYRSFFKKLLGPGWLIYEMLYFLMMILVLSIVGAAAGDILRDTFGIPAIVGSIAIMVLVALLVFYGTAAVERFLAGWSFVLYGTYVVFLGWNLIQHGGAISDNFAGGEFNSGWVDQGIKYAGYNVALAPVLLFCMRHSTRRGDAVTAGLLAGPIAMIPGALFFVAMVGQYDAILAEGPDGTLPITLLLNSLTGAGFFVYLFPIVLFGTFVETGAALIHGVNERLGHTYEERGAVMPQWLRPAVALGILVTAIFVADAVGLSSLVAQGYGTITYGFLLIFVVPILTWGIWLIWRAERGNTAIKGNET